MAMNSTKNATNNAAEAAVEEKKEATVMDNTVEQKDAAPVAEQAQQPVEVPVATEAGTQVPAEVTKVPFGTKVKTFFKEKVVPVAKTAGTVAIGVVIGVIGTKVIDAVTDSKLEEAYEPDNSSEPDYNPDDDLGDSGVEDVSES